ncbi:hypothetical protein ALC152_01460 [Arcobacter sp. 15-2]
MALIKCEECGNQISDKADKCLHCGNPINKKKILLKTIQKLIQHKVQVNL